MVANYVAVVSCISGSDDPDNPGHLGDLFMGQVDLNHP